MNAQPQSPYCPHCMQWRGHKATCPLRNGTGQPVSTDYSLEAYHEFLKAKATVSENLGYCPDMGAINPWLKPHQKTVVQWAVHGGRRAIFASFGLGKTVIQLETLRLILEYENRCISATAIPATPSSTTPSGKTNATSSSEPSSTDACLAEGYQSQQNQSPNRALIVAPLGVRQEFKRDAQRLGIDLRFVRSMVEVEQLELEFVQTDHTRIYLTNYETVRDGKLDPRHFVATSLDEAAVLRGFGGTKTFREFMRVFETVKYRFVATATPDPNEYIELLAYAAYLGIMDVSQAKTRFFKRDSTKADKLTIHPHKEAEFWLWVASWALFLRSPSDLGFSDEGYALTNLEVIHHEVPVDHTQGAEPERDGQHRLFREALHGVVDAAREKRTTLPERIEKMKEILAAEPEEHFLLWHDLEAERHAIQKAVPGVTAVWGSMKTTRQKEMDEREQAVIDFSDGKIQYLAGKPVMLGAGCNFQRHCARAIFVGIGFKFNDFIQAVHRIHRFLQNRPVKIHLIYAESERQVLKILMDKWERHKKRAQHMSELIQQYGLSQNAMIAALGRSLGVERLEISDDAPGTPNRLEGDPWRVPDSRWKLVNNDCVDETHRMPDNSVHLILTSIPFSTQYEYSPSYNDFGHTDDNEHFFRQMNFLTPELFRVLKPGRLCAIHVKDRIVPGGITGLGFQTVYPFHCKCIDHYTSHGFAFMGMKTIVTDVVRENNQTYRMGWTEQCKDGTKMGYGIPEYLLLFRKPPTDTSNAYADEPVVKSKAQYSRSRWQIDAHGFARSSGNRPLMPEDLEGVAHAAIFKMFRKYSLEQVYDFEHHVHLGEVLEAKGILPVTFMLLQPQSWHPDVWTDITRMRTLNGAQSAKGKEMHLCLARDSMVLTKERGYVPIQDVMIEENVLTHRARWRPVEMVKMTGVRPTISIHAQGVPELRLTPDHNLWTRKSDWAREREGAESAEPGWTPASETLGGYLNFKLPDAESPSTSDLLHWWIVGRWLADGHWDGRGSAIISCGHHEVPSLLDKLADHSGGCYDTITAHQVRVLDPDGTIKTTLHQCGHGADGKHLPPEAFTLPVEQSSALLEGYLSGDGHFNKEHQRWMATAVNRTLLLGMAFLAQRACGAIASIYRGRPARETEIEGRRVHCKQEWVFCFYLNGEERRKQQFILDDGAWKRVRSLEDAGLTETWCLQVAEDASFTADGCIVKNCPMQFDLADRVIAQNTMEGETVYDPFAGLGTVPMRAIKQKRKAIGVELSASYFTDALTYVRMAAVEAATPTLFDLIEAEESEDGMSTQEAEATGAAVPERKVRKPRSSR